MPPLPSTFSSPAFAQHFPLRIAALLFALPRCLFLPCTPLCRHTLHFTLRTRPHCAAMCLRLRPRAGTRRRTRVTRAGRMMDRNEQLRANYGAVGFSRGSPQFYAVLYSSFNGRRAHPTTHTTPRFATSAFPHSPPPHYTTPRATLAHLCRAPYHGHTHFALPTSAPWPPHPPAHYHAH